MDRKDAMARLGQLAAVFDQQQQKGGSAENRLAELAAFFDQQQQKGGGGNRLEGIASLLRNR